MNDNHSHKELKYRYRWLSETIGKTVRESPVIVLTGARQVGKSTLLGHETIFKGWKYITLDDYAALAQAQTEPESLWAGTNRVIIDEVQKAPGMLHAIKRSVDKDRSKHRFVLSGSANLLLMKQVSESLAGRALYFELPPMAIGEMLGRPVPGILALLFSDPDSCLAVKPRTGVSPFKLMVQGCMPALMELQERESALRWWEGYVATYLERDLRQLSQVESLADFRKAMSVAALRSGQVVNQTEMARDAAISQATMFRYLNLLETTCLFRRLPAFSNSRTRRLVKSPKAYFLDPGLATFLCGYYDEQALKTSREAGSIFETLILVHLVILAELMVPRAKICYWRTVSGAEVDFVLEYGKRALPIEIKLSSTVHPDDAKGLKAFLADNPSTEAGVLVYTGTEIKKLGDRILAMPWTVLAGM